MRAESRSIATLLDEQRDALDRLIAEIELGPRDQRHFDALEERAQAIADGLRSAFRTFRRKMPAPSPRTG